MLDDFDERANHLGVKGIGELGAGGTGGVGRQRGLQCDAACGCAISRSRSTSYCLGLPAL